MTTLLHISGLLIITISKSKPTFCLYKMLDISKTVLFLSIKYNWGILIDILEIWNKLIYIVLNPKILYTINQKNHTIYQVT